MINPSRSRVGWVAAWVCIALGMPALAGDGAIAPAGLRCEYLADPLGIDVARPRLSWKLSARDASARGLTQTAYQIVVAESIPVLGKATELAESSGSGERASFALWDSGRVASSQTNQVEYAGEPIGSRQAAVWRVRVWDQDGRVSPWSDRGSWRMGLLSPQDWGEARWIGHAAEPPKGHEPLAPPLLRKAFSCDPSTHGFALRRATAYVSALGLYELHINGKRVGDHVLAPEWTDYHKRIQYQTYDVTDLIRAGDNAIGVMLGDGWYAGKIGLTGIVPGGPPRAIYGRTPKLLLRLEIERADGGSQVIVSDGSWRSTTDGPIRVADLLDGETYDATREIIGWDAADCRRGEWSPVRVFDAPAARLVAQPNEPIRVTRELTPIAVTEPKPGVYVFDMGQNMVGWCRLRVSGQPGHAEPTTITLRHAEVLNPDGTIYTANLRGAAQTDRFTTSGGGGEEFYEPRFTYHGFRYVEVGGLREKPSLDLLIGRVVHSACPEVSSFECSEPLLNKLWQNILWTQRANLHSTPTDCPQRDERCGWMGDILAFAPTACFNMDMAAFLTKWIPDTRDAQATDGRFADFSPQPFDPNVRFSGVPAWGDAGVFVPWTAYQYYGDKRLLAEQYDAAVKWVEYIRGKNPDLLWVNARGNDYGDWLNADTLRLEGWPAKGAEIPKHVFATAFFARSTQIVAEMARVLEKRADAEKYAALASEIRAAFCKAYLKPDGFIEGDTQAGYAIALHFDLLPEPIRAAAAQRMVERFKPYDGLISTGFHSTAPLMLELSRRGFNDDAYRLALNRRMPSWGYAIEHGATTIWERWDGYVEGRGFQDPGMNSFSHYAIGAVGEWMMRTMVGISPDDDAPGFARFTISPRPGPGVTWARGSYDSIRGAIRVDWRIDGDALTMGVEVPPNTSATIVFPTRDAADVSEGDAKAGNARGVQFLGHEGGAVRYRVGSGRYSFRTPAWR